MRNRIAGNVVWFSDQKGYGFITGEDGKSYFVHWKEVDKDVRGHKTLKSGQTVSFVPSQNQKGLAAVEVETERATKWME